MSAETTSAPATSAAATTAPPTSGAGAGAGTPAAAEDFLALCPAETAPDSLTIAIWGSHEEAIGEEMAGFTDLTGVDIEWHVDGTPDRLVKLNAERGAPTIDLAVLPVNEISTLLDNGVIDPKDDRVPNSDLLVDVAAGVPGGWGTSQIQFAIAYNPDQVTEAPDAWLDLLDPAYAGHVSLSNVPGSGGYAPLAMFARESGGSEADLVPAIEMVGDVVDDIVAFTDQAQATIQMFDTGELWLAPAIAGTMLQYQQDGGNIELAIPATGGPIGMNVGVIPAGNPDADCALALLGWYLGPEVQAKYAETLHYTPVNTAVEIPADLVVFPADQSTAVAIDWAAIQERSDEYADLWARTVGG